MKIITSDKENLLTSTSITFKNTSSDLISSKNIYIISDVALTKLSCKIMMGNQFQLFNVVSNVIEKVDEITLTNVTSSMQNSKFVYQINLYFSVENEGSYSSILKLMVDDNVHTLTLLGKSVKLDEKLVVTLQNFRQTFDDDYLIAFFESNPKSNATDFELYNRKIREFLMNIHNLVAMHGSYKNLFDAIKFFGYGDLLELREYWTNENIYKSTSISNYVLNYIDKSLAGFKKTNKMSLVYQINEEVGFDEDGLPLYNTIFSITQDILLKMEALKRILEKDFLHFNSFIVDIIGEMQTVIGIELNVLWQNAAVYNVHLTDNLYVDVDFKLNKELLKIKNNRVKVNHSIYQIINDELTTRPNFIDYSNTMIFEIDKIYDSSNDVLEDEFVEGYYQNTFGILKVDIALMKERYQSFTYRIYNETELVFLSDFKDIDEFQDSIIVGFQESGLYKIDISFVDWYGGNTIVGFQQFFEILNNDVVMHMLSYNHVTNKTKFTSLATMSTYEDNQHLSAYPITDSLLDINTFDQLTNNQQLSIKNSFKSSIDNYSTYTRANELNGVALKTLTDIKLDNFGSTYFSGIIDMIGNKDNISQRVLKIFNHTNQQIVEIELFWDNSETEEIWLAKFIQKINESEEEIFKDFTYDIQVFGIEDDNQIIEKLMLRIRSVEASYKKRFVNLEIVGFERDTLFLEQFILKDVHVHNKIFATTCSTIIEPSTDDLIITFDDDEIITIQSVNIDDLSDLKNAIDAIVSTKKINCYVDEDRKLFYLTSNHNFIVQHSSIGKLYDNVRGKQFEKAFVLEQGVELKYGESFIAEFDDINLADMSDITWSLFDETINKLITVQKSSRLVYVAKRRTTYSILVEFYINSKKYEVYHVGCFLVK